MLCFLLMSIDVHCNYVGLLVVKQPKLLCRTNEHHIYVVPTVWRTQTIELYTTWQLYC